MVEPELSVNDMYQLLLLVPPGWSIIGLCTTLLPNARLLPSAKRVVPPVMVGAVIVPVAGDDDNLVTTEPERLIAKSRWNVSKAL